MKKKAKQKAAVVRRIGRALPFVVVLLLLHDQSGTVRVNEKTNASTARKPLAILRGVWRFYGSQLLRTASDFGYAPAVGSVKQYISLKSHLWDFPRTCPCPSEIRHYRAHRPLRRARRYPDRPPP